MRKRFFEGGLISKLIFFINILILFGTILFIFLFKTYYMNNRWIRSVGVISFFVLISFNLIDKAILGKEKIFYVELIHSVGNITSILLAASISSTLISIPNWISLSRLITLYIFTFISLSLYLFVFRLRRTKKSISHNHNLLMNFSLGILLTSLIHSFTNDISGKRIQIALLYFGGLLLIYTLYRKLKRRTKNEPN